MRYTRYLRAEIDRAIHDANLANLSIKQAMEFVKDKTGITIGHTQYVERKRILRRRAIDLWTRYKTDDYAYRLEHLERINEARLVRDTAVNKLLQYKDDPKRFFQWKMAAYAVLDASQYLSELYSLIPEIDAIGHEMGNPTEEIQSEQIPGTMAALTQAKF